MDNADVNGICRIKDGVAYLDYDVGVTDDGIFKIRITKWANALRYRFCDKDKDWEGENADQILEKIYEQILTEIDKFIKRLRGFCQCTKCDWYSLAFLYLEYQIKASVTEEYNRICNIMEDSPDEDVIDGVEWFDWIIHEINYPGESIPDWKAREEREKKEREEMLNRLFGSNNKKEE